MAFSIQCFAFLLMCMWAQWPALASDGNRSDTLEVQSALDYRVSSGWTLRLHPTRRLFEPYVADPRQPRNVLGLSHVSRSDIPSASHRRIELNLGGQFGLLRVHRSGNPDGGWQLDIGASIYQQYDQRASLDQIGHEGFGVGILSMAVRNNLVLKLQLQHVSSHLGDEYMEKTGRQRINYRKEEFAVGLSWNPSSAFRTYGEAGYGINLGPMNKPLRLQGGIEFTSRPVFGESGHYYAALDLSTWEEDQFETTYSFQTGIEFRFSEVARVLRFGLQFYDGRALLNEFFFLDERYFSAGVWMDF